MTRQIQILIKGKVQGVFYRKSTKLQAERLGIVGTVENLDNGDVLIHAQGEQDSLTSLVKWTHHGPVKAEVISVVVKNLLNHQYFTKFRILY